MIKKVLTVLFCFSIMSIVAQELDKDLLRIQRKLDTISAFKADMELEVAISFINMPKKIAVIEFEKGKPITFSSKDFTLIPKRGLDFSFQELFKYSYITVDRGMEKIASKELKMINVIPTDKRADFSIATLYLDLKYDRIAISEISTKKDGTYKMLFRYADAKSILPKSVEVQFEIERIRIPLNFMGKDVEVDKEQLRKEEIKTGKIFLSLDYKNIRYK